MSSYNDYDGVPISGSSYWLIDKLRKEYGFHGYVVSDSDAVEYLYNKHHTAETNKEAVRQAVMAGVNVRTQFLSAGEVHHPAARVGKGGENPDERARSAHARRPAREV